MNSPQIQLDQSTFMPLDTASQPRQRSAAPASSSPASMPGPDYSHVQLDPSTFSPIGGHSIGQASDNQQPGIGERVWKAGKEELGNLAGGIAAPIKAVAAPPEDATEHTISSISGHGGLIAYRASKAVVDAAENLFKSKKENFQQAAVDMLHAVNEFHNKDYRNALTDTGSVVADIGGVTGEPISTMGRAREIIQGTKPGGDMATPLTKDVVDVGATAALDRIGGKLAKEIEVPKDITGRLRSYRAAEGGEAAAGEVATAKPGFVKQVVKGAGKILNPEEINPAELKEPARPVSTHTKTELPLDDATIRKSFNKDLSQEARDTLREKVGNTVPAGSSVENTLMKAVAPVNKTIEEQGLALNKVLQNAGEMKTNSATEVTTALEKLKKPFDLEAEKPIRDAIDSESAKAREAMLSKNPVELNNYIRELDKQIKSYTAPEEAVDTVSQARDAAKVTIRRAIRNKLSAEIPETKPINDVLAKNLEARGGLRDKFGDVAYDSVAADAQHMSELQKGQTHMVWEQKVSDLKAEYQNAVERANLIKKALVYGGLPAGSLLGAEVLKHVVP